MASSIRRKVRRYLLGATPKATRVWWIGQVTVRVMSPCKKEGTRTVREKAHYGAEKSCQTRRRKRGLRKGKVRSRGVQPRRSLPPRQPLTKPLSSRAVNHAGRKFIWAQKARAKLAVKARRMLRTKSRTFFSQVLGRETSNRAVFKSALRTQWKSLSDRAAASGIPHQAAFHLTFQDFLNIEAFDSPGEGFADLLSFLPRREDFTEVSQTHHVETRLDVVPHTAPGGGSPAGQLVQLCLQCGSVGPHRLTSRYTYCEKCGNRRRRGWR